MDGGNAKKPWWFFAGAILIFALTLFGNRLEGTLVLILVILLFAAAFGALLVLSIRQWKKPDREIISDYLILAASLFHADTKDLKPLALRFLSSVAFVAFVLVKLRNGSPVPYLFCGGALLLTGLPLLGALLGWSRDTSDEQAYREGSLIAILIGLATCGFFCFFMGIGIVHGVWWFVCPPGLIFLSFFARPLVAGLRILFFKEKDPGEKHVRKHRDIDPWDRPDRKP